MKRELLALVCVGLLSAPALRAADARKGGDDTVAAAQATGVTTADAAGAQAKPAADAPDHKPDEKVTRKEEVTVESASKSETTIVDAPATMSVVTGQTIANSPAQNYADLLRSVPGMNVIQTSARDLNLTTRQSTSTLNNSQLVLVDGRSVYLDFFGLVLWDFVPNPASGDIKQIEVVRGPASVVWGANALTGVVNVITKSPREHEGFGATLGAGLFSRKGGSRDGDGSGQQWNGNFSFANAVNDTWSYKLTAGYYNSDPYSRPVGSVPLACHPYGVSPCRDANGNALPGGYPVGGAPYPADKSGLGSWENNGTSQPKVTLRLDQELGQGGATAASRTRAATRAPRASSTPASDRSTSRTTRTWPTARPCTRRARCASGPSRTSSTRTRRTCCSPTPPRASRSSWGSRPTPTTSRSATRTCSAASTS